MPIKRQQRNIYTLLQAVKNKRGYTNKQLANKLGIKPRTLYSYYSSMKGYKPNKNNRQIPKKIILRIKKMASNRNIRITENISNRYLYEYFATFKVIFKQDKVKVKREGIELFHILGSELKTIKNVRRFVNRELTDKYKDLDNNKSGEFLKITDLKIELRRKIKLKK